MAAATRHASHAGSWYSADKATLQSELDAWTHTVPDSIQGLGPVPQLGARVIIAPHAGYAYSGPTAAWAYKSLDLTNAKRVFLLGPSHHKYLARCALSKHSEYATPLGSIPLDKDINDYLRSTGWFEDMSFETDRAEHSLEMHLPYIYYTLAARASNSQLIPLVPILIGSTTPDSEKVFGGILAPYLADRSNVFVISSDFCHWGTRFNYTYYLTSLATSVAHGQNLSDKARPNYPPIHESIQRIDYSAIEAICSGSHDVFLRNLKDTGNTVCGRHPIGVIMAAIESLKEEGKLQKDKGLFKFVRYTRSSDVVEGSSSSVSYASAFAVL